MTRTSRIDKDIDALLTTSSRSSRTTKARQAKVKATKAETVRSKAASSSKAAASRTSGTTRTPPSPSSSGFIQSSPSKASTFTHSSEIEDVSLARHETHTGPWGWRYLKEVHRDGTKKVIKLTGSISDVRRHLNKFMIDLHYACMESHLDPSYSAVFQRREEDLSRCIQEASTRLLDIQTDFEVLGNWIGVLEPLEEDTSEDP